MASAQIEILTRLGRALIDVNCVGRDDNPCELGHRVGKHAPRWPKGGPVESLQVALIQARCDSGIAALHVRAHMEGTGIHDFENGEWLEARSYIDQSRLVMLGMEDGDVIFHRIPGLIAPHGDPFCIVGGQDGIRSELVASKRITNLTIHVAVAENPWPEPKELAARDAVNVNHGDLVNAFGLPLEHQAA